MRFWKFHECLFKGHIWINSKAKRGFRTCQRCRLRLRDF
jgi:hypothetical protein